MTTPIGIIGGVAISCGPATVYGAVKGLIDLGRYIQVAYSQFCVKNRLKKLDAKQIDEIESLKAIRHRLLHDAREIRFDLTSDALMMIPLAGAILAHRYAAPGKSMMEGIGVQLSPYLFDQLEKRIFPIQNTEPSPDLQAKMYLHEQLGWRTSIDARMPGDPEAEIRTIDALHILAEGKKPSDPTVVVFHGNGSTCHDMVDAAETFRKAGYNVVAITICSYPGSSKFDISEVSVAQDLESTKRFLAGLGVTKAGYYGLSLGASLVMTAVTQKSNYPQVETQFGIVDQPFLDGAEVSDMWVSNHKNIAFLNEAARGASKRVLAKNEFIPLGKGLYSMTDGLNNGEKARDCRKKEIPLMTIVARDDIYMSRLGKPESNVGYSLFQNRYQGLTEYEQLRAERLIELQGEHGDQFYLNKAASQKVTQFVTEGYLHGSGTLKDVG